MKLTDLAAKARHLADCTCCDDLAGTLRELADAVDPNRASADDGLCCACRERSREVRGWCRRCYNRMRRSEA